MTIKELRKTLRKRPDNMPVVMAFRNHERVELVGIWAIEEEEQTRNLIDGRLILKSRCATQD